MEWSSTEGTGTVGVFVASSHSIEIEIDGRRLRLDDVALVTSI